MTKRRLLFLLLIIVLIVAMVLLVRRRRREIAGMPPPKEYAAVVEAATVEKGRVTAAISYLGEIVPLTETVLAAKTTGFVREVGVEEGDRVDAGRLLVKIDDRDIVDRIRALRERERAAEADIAAVRASLAGLRTALETARGIYERNRVLRENKAIGQEELDISRKNFALAEAELKSTRSRVKSLEANLAALAADRRALEQSLDYTTIKAPYAGVVSKRDVDAGDLAVPGRPLLTLVDPAAGVKIVVPVAPSDYLGLQVGSPALLHFSGRTLKARIAALYPAADGGGRALCHIILSRAPFGLPFHSRLEVGLVVGSREGLKAPIDCLLRQPQRQLVIRIDDQGRARPQTVEILQTGADFFSFVSDEVTAGDRLVRARESRLMRIFAGQKLVIATTGGE
ncbi:MAG: efflux RND transporter periplasmic adaptor subunit [Deltaproteobacteria bacterium]|nr:efflux RND transporter periplasmic adaptor subunit [Deltaproteobacteria bacterium]